jgi:hypothetical protein
VQETPEAVTRQIGYVKDQPVAAEQDREPANDIDRADERPENVRRWNADPREATAAENRRKNELLDALAQLLDARERYAALCAASPC